MSAAERWSTQRDGTNRRQTLYGPRVTGRGLSTSDTAKLRVRQLVMQPPEDSASSLQGLGARARVVALQLMSPEDAAAVLAVSEESVRREAFKDSKLALLKPAVKELLKVQSEMLMRDVKAAPSTTVAVESRMARASETSLTVWEQQHFASVMREPPSLVEL